MKKYQKQRDYDKKFIDKNGNTWEYYSIKKMREIYSKNFKDKVKVIGELTNNEEKNVALLSDDTKEEKYHYIGNIQTNKKFQRHIGYVVCDNDEYVAINGTDWKKVGGILISVLALVLLIVGGLQFRDNGPSLDGGASDYESKLKRPANWDDSKIAIPGYDEIVAKKGEGAAYVALYNPEGNPVYFQFEVIMDDTEEVLLKTDLIEPGKAVKAIPISKELEEGEYNITLKISTYSIDDYKQKMNGGEVKTKLKVMDE
ncbi:hypothetical protein IGJ01_000951 [Enterococcus sp. AZ089]|uniref:hypothetical protein n=1 Tax=unclassified Enterococcus TaxID=2608891 RepID=UPI003D2FDCD0